MRNLRAAVPALLSAVIAIGSCSPREEGLLQARRALGSSLQEAIDRWGEPEHYTPDPLMESGHGFASWPDVAGARITAFSRMGRIIWVTYRFHRMDPFDEAEAFRLVGVDPDPKQARHLRSPGAKRWSPFGEYQKLTVSPATRMVAIGRDPMNRVQASELSTDPPVEAPSDSGSAPE